MFDARVNKNAMVNGHTKEDYMMLCACEVSGALPWKATAEPAIPEYRL